MKTRIFVALVASALAAALLGCSNNPNRTALGHVEMRLTDAPGDFEQVNIVITGVSIHRDGSGWETIKQDATTYDLLKLQGGLSTILASADAPAGHYTQIRVLLGEGSNLVLNGETHPIEIPSGMQSGYKLVGQFDVPEGGSVDLTVDFDAARSVIKSTDGTYKLRPTIQLVKGS